MQESTMDKEAEKEITGSKDQNVSVLAEGTQQNAVVSAQPFQSSVTDIPDGGWKAWSVVCGGWCAMFVSVGWNNSAGVLQTIYETDQLRSYSPSAVGWIISLQTFFMFACAPISGRLFDTYGPRFPLLAGSLLHVFGVMMMSLSTEYYQFILSQSVCTGIGAGAIFFAASNTIATWFKRNRALALGIASSGSATGGVVIPIMVNHVYRIANFGWALRAVGFVFLAMVIVANIFVQSRLKPTRKKLNVKEFVYPLQEPPFLLLSFACFSFAMAVYLPGTFIILDALSKGMSSRLASYLLSILNASSVIGRIVAGRLADQIGRFNCMILTTFLSAVFVLAVWIPATSNAILILFVSLIGFTNGAYVALVSALVAQISDLKQIGTRNGTNWFMYGIGALIGTPIAGALIGQDDGGYLYMKIFSGIAMFVSACLFFCSRTVQVGFRWKWI